MEVLSNLATFFTPGVQRDPADPKLFGTDAGPNGPGVDWEESAWMGSHRLRRALAIALTGMVKDGVIGEPRAREIADGVLRRNAVELYRLEKSRE